MSEWYWLVDGEVVPAPAGGKMLQPFEDRRIALDYLGDPDDSPYVSTVFLGLDHGGGYDHRHDRKPLVFETMVFWHDHELDNDGARYETLEEAKTGHHRFVERVKLAMATEVWKSVTFTVEAGVLVRGDIKRSVIAYGAANGLEIEVKEEKGLLESIYVFSAKGQPLKLRAFVADITRMMKEHGAES